MAAQEHQAQARRLIGEIIVDLGFTDTATVAAAIASAREQGKTTGQLLLEQGTLTENQLAHAVAERFGIEYVDLSEYDVDLGAFNLLSIEAARMYQSVPIGFVGEGTLLVAMAEPNNVMTIDDLSMITGLKVKPVATSREDVRMLLARLGQAEGAIDESAEEDGREPEAGLDQTPTAEDAPIIKLVRSIIGQAVALGASDIHFDPEPTQMRVLLRIDGLVMPASTTVRRSMAPAVISRLKIMADLDISEKRVPQDGRFGVTIDGRRVDIRLVTLPLVGGEAIVLRILDRGVEVRDLEGLEMLEQEQARFNRALSQRQGAVLVTGPTGSGKSTTLYAALSVLSTGDRSILTIEDPVERQLVGVKQMQIAPKAGITFATGLRSMLRADPDVIMVGEIRDRETARIAIEAALTGHLVLSTLHTRDAPSALTRLVDMGIEPFLLVAAIECVVAQRLARRLCPYCKRRSSLPQAVLEEQGLEGIQPYEAVGCGRCGGTGFRGRIGLFEVMTVTEEIRAILLARGSVNDMRAAAIEQGMRPIRECGMAKVRSGETSIAEVGRVAGLS